MRARRLERLAPWALAAWVVFMVFVVVPVAWRSALRRPGATSRRDRRDHAGTLMTPLRYGARRGSSSHHPSLHGVRRRRAQVVRAVRVVQRVEHPGRGDRAASDRPAGTAPRLAPASAGRAASSEVSTTTAQPRPTGIGELDRVLGGGLVPGSVTLLGGEPGIGKSTLLLQVLGDGRGRAAALYVSAEESAQQVRAAGRAARCRSPRPVAPGRDGAARTSSPPSTRCSPTSSSIDSIQTVVRSRARRRRRARSCRCASAPTASCRRRSAAGIADRARRPRHQGRRAGRAAGARARGRHGARRSRASATTRCACCGR